MSEDRDYVYRVCREGRDGTMTPGEHHASIMVARQELSETVAEPNVTEAWLERALLGAWEKIEQ